MDSRFYFAALREFIDANPDKGSLKFHELNITDISRILQRAQALKDTDTSRTYYLKGGVSHEIDCTDDFCTGCFQG